jgi:hypothetical protein
VPNSGYISSATEPDEFEIEGATIDQIRAEVERIRPPNREEAINSRPEVVASARAHDFARRLMNYNWDPDTDPATLADTHVRLEELANELATVSEQIERWRVTSVVTILLSWKKYPADKKQGRGGRAVLATRKDHLRLARSNEARIEAERVQARELLKDLQTRQDLFEDRKRDAEDLACEHAAILARAAEEVDRDHAPALARIAELEAAISIRDRLVKSLWKTIQEVIRDHGDQVIGYRACDATWHAFSQNFRIFVARYISATREDRHALMLSTVSSLYARCIDEEGRKRTNEYLARMRSCREEASVMRGGQTRSRPQ